MARVHHVRTVSPSAYVLRLDRGGMLFEPGQYLNLGEAGSTNVREYSIYSASTAPYLEVLIKEIKGGTVSRLLRRAQPGHALQCEGPFGFFTISDAAATRPLLFIATGTGISPFHAFVGSRPGLDYQLLHGVRSPTECYDSSVYAASRYQACVSGPDLAGAPAFRGRVTDYVREHPVAVGTRCFVCGNSEMIYEIFDLLRRQGIGSTDIAAEVYF